MNVSKAILKAYIEKKSREQRYEIDMKIKDALSEALYPVVDKVFYELNGDIASKKAESIYKTHEFITQQFNLGWDRGAGVLRSLSVLINLKDTLRDRVVRLAQSVLSGHSDYDPKVNYMGDFPEEIKDALIEAVEKQKPVYKAIRDLNTLESELLDAITVAVSGKRAYETLEKLGVDLSDLQGPNPNLPAIVKLSVPVELLNKYPQSGGSGK